MLNHILEPNRTVEVVLPSFTLHLVPPLIPPISDLCLSVAVPIVLYWALAAFFEILERGNYFQRYKCHTSAEEILRNRVSRWECVRGVVLNQFTQTVLVLAVSAFSDGDYAGGEEYDVNVWARRLRSVHAVLLLLPSMIGINVEGTVMKYGGAAYLPNR